MKLERVIIVLALLWSGAGLAAIEHPAQILVESSISRVLQILAENSERIKTDQAFILETIDTHISPGLDFNSMTRLALGKNWKKASKAQRKLLIEQFRKLLLNTYSKSLAQYSGQSIDFLPFREGKREDRAKVRSEFKQSGGVAIPIVYKLLNKGSWKIYDIAIDGISLITTYRNGFSKKIRADGIDGLIEQLRDKNAGA